MRLMFLRYKREEVKIQAWEIQQRAKYEAEMRKAEVYFPFLLFVVLGALDLPDL